MTDWSFAENNSVVNRYVKSLYEVAVSSHTEQEIYSQLSVIKNTILQIEGYEKFIKRVALISSEGLTFVRTLIEDLQLSMVMGNFLKLLWKNRRLILLLEVCDTYTKFVEKAHGERVFYVTYAKEFSKKDEKALLMNLSEMFGDNIRCLAKKDESLIGGITVQYRSKILDYSVKSKLKRLRNAIRGDNYEN